MATETLPIHRPVNRNAERIFFSGMAILLCVVVFIGFSPTYFRAGMFRAPLPAPSFTSTEPCSLYGWFSSWCRLLSSRLAAWPGTARWARSRSVSHRS